MTLRCAIAVALVSAYAWGQAPADRAVGLAASAGTARLTRRGTESDLALRAGDLLFAGDRISVQGEGTVVWFCPSSQVIRLMPGVVRVGADKLTGALGPTQSAGFCPVPGVDRERLTRPSYLGQEISRTRDLQSRTPAEEAAALAPEARAQMDAELRTIEQASGDAALRDSATAAVYAKYNLHQAAADALGRLSNTWTGVDWPRALIHEQHEQMSRGADVPGAAKAPGQTYALLVGVSEYAKLPPDQRLLFADKDAELLHAYLRSPRGGALPAENIHILRNKEATVGGIRTGIAEFLRARATENDTVIFMMAAHGVASADGAYIVAYDSDPDNLRDSGLNMLEIQQMMEGAFDKVGHVMIFVDVCHAGTIGNIQNKDFTRVLQVLGRFKGEDSFGLLASAPSERSVESTRFGGGHGAFSYFLSRALNGDADEDGDKKVTVNELQAYVYNMVRQATKNKQNPRTTGDMPGESIVTPDVSRQGIEIAAWQTVEQALQAQTRGVGAEIPSYVLPPGMGGADVERFERAVNEGRLLPPDRDNARDLLEGLRRSLAANPLQLLLLENRLRVALQDRGQAVILTYLRGEEVPQRQDNFQEGARWFQAVQALAPEALGWQSRLWFCQARAMLFDGRYKDALDLLERAARVEPEGAYIFNALGLLHLQQASYREGEAAFRDAIRLAPYWSYPRHNLALVLAQTGAYEQARAVYRDAQRIAPQAWFIPYNLGLVEQRVNRLRDAERLFRQAAADAPQRPEPETALGFLAAYRGNAGDAEKFYRQALAKDPAFLPARHDLALLLASSGRGSEAFALWEAILKDDPGYTASRMALAGALETAGRREDALVQYREAIARDPQFTAGRLAAARVLVALAKPEEAEREARTILASQPQSASAQDALGDALAAQGRAQQAIDAYVEAVRLGGGEQRKAIEKKLKRARSRHA